MLTTGERLDDLIKKHGGTVKEIAAGIGVSASMLSEITNHDPQKRKSPRSMNSDTVVKICRYFNVSADYLLGLSEISCPNETIQGIGNLTGLSANAIVKLEVDNECQTNHYIDFLNLLIESDMFAELAELVTLYTGDHYGGSVNIDLGGSNLSFDEINIETTSFFRTLIADYLFKIIGRRDKHGMD